MQTHFDLLAFINLLGVAQGFFLSFVFLLSRQGSRLSNCLLGFLLLVSSLVTLEIFACHTNLVAHFPFFINLTEPFVFLIGPLLYFYTLSLIRPDWRWQTGRHKWLHFVPAAVYAVLRLPYLLQSGAFKLADVQAAYHRIPNNPVSLRRIWWFPEYDFGGGTLDILSFALVLGYAARTGFLAWRFTSSRGEPFWNSSVRSLRWLVRLMALFGALLLAGTFTSLFLEDDTGDIYIGTAFTAVFYAIGFLLVKDSMVLAQNRLEPERKRYGNSSLNGADTATHLQRLRQLMQTAKPHLDSNLTLPQLAAKLNLSTHHLSQLLNEQLGKNFFDFVNEYRIAEMKEKLHDPALAHLKIEELAYQCGFNSKSVFNTAFKKATGKTPSGFRKTAKPA